MTIKILLIVGLSSAAFLAYRGPLTARNTALRRLFGAGMLGAAATAVIWPNMVSGIAHRMGVGRGADLVLYVLALVSLFVWVSMYRRFHELERRLTSLTQHIALSEARSEGYDATAHDAL